MTERQDAIDALNECTRLNNEYNAILDSFSQPGGRGFTVTELEDVGLLMDKLEAARSDYHEKTRLWVESGDD